MGSGKGNVKKERRPLVPEVFDILRGILRDRVGIVEPFLCAGSVYYPESELPDRNSCLRRQWFQNIYRSRCSGQL